jgi:chromosome segregation protein
MGIVGPNGCGKSNIIDAIRWVLGEGSAKTLRGDSMSDVIFNGSGGRKPVGVASIELTFDNADGTITGPYAGYSEVAVRRTVSRDGTSQYYLNNGRCRRKDITQILLGTGLGGHGGYSIIEQGMISRLVEAKPEDMRSFLEEAAGISKYKERRRETEHRIQHTRDNLARLADLRDEIEKQLVHLQKQAKDAEKYKATKAEQRRVGAELLALRLTSLRGEVDDQERQFAERQLALEAAITAQGSAETTIEKLRVELADRSERFNAVQANYYRIGSEIARLEQAVQHRKELIQRQTEDLKGTDAQIAEIQAHIASDEVELAQLDELLGELAPGLEQAQALQRSSQLELEDAERVLEGWRERAQQLGEELAAAERSTGVEDTLTEQLRVQGDRLEKERQRHADERATLSSADIENRLATLVANEERLVAAFDNASRALETTTQQIQQLREQERNVSEHLNQLREQLENDRVRLASLEALQDVALGTSSEQVGRWLKAQSLSERHRLAQDLVVEPGWERAVETVLGPYLQAVTIRSIEDVAGRLPELTEGGLAIIESAAASGGAGEDTLLARVRAPADVAPLLAGVRVAESLANAVARRGRLAPGESLITRDGYWIGPHWVRISSNNDPQVGVIARGEEIKRLQTVVTSTSRRIEDVTKALADTRTQLDQLEDSRATAQTDATQRQQAQAEAKTELAACRAELEQVRARAATLDVATANLDTERNALARSLEESRARRDRSEAQRLGLATERERSDEHRRELQERVTEARTKAEQHRDAAQAIAIRVESRRSTKESASAALTRVQGQLSYLKKRQSELRGEIEGSAEPLASDERTLVGKLDERLGVEADLGNARTATDEIDTQLREAEQERVTWQRSVNELREAADQVRLQLREAQVRAETVAEQFAETGFELDKVVAELPPEATHAAWHETFEQLERRIQRLGAINLAAIDELKEQSERKTYLDAQYVDLTEALETLENAIRRIDRETRTRFQETFEKANQGLGRLFPRLFGGGHAYLELDGEDILSAGVTVMARPPGKKNSTIHLLSGGEKALTAVALVFSIFELNPAPFCLLDEVDAPLDDANVGRFSEIVREMSGRVQFVIITHNKTTMEAMHQLTGVTMHEPGVSRMVAVDIDEAVRLAAM